MSALMFPALGESIRAGLADWHVDHWKSLPQPCVPLAYFPLDLQQVVIDAGMHVRDLAVCRNPDDDGAPWSQWVYEDNPTCVGFSALGGADETCEARHMFCAGSPNNIMNLEFGSYGSWEMQVAAVVAAVNFELGVHQLCPTDGIPTVVPTEGPPEFLLGGCTDPTAENYNELADHEDWTCTYPRSNSDFGMEARWWMNWRLPTQNIQWIKDHPNSITTIIPAHNMFRIQYDGTLKRDKWFRPERHLGQYKTEVPHVHVLPVLDFLWNYTHSAIYSAFVLGDEVIYNNLLDTAQEVADLAVEFDFSGWILDYEPYFDYSLEHTKAMMSFVQAVKDAIDDADRRILPSSRYTRRRVGLCLSNWGIINVNNEEMVAEYLQSRVDIFMSMAYTYFMREEGEAGFAELRKRVIHMKQTFGAERTTIGISVEVGNPSIHRWYNAGQTMVDEYISFIRDVGLSAVSVWGMWDTYGEREQDPDIEIFAQPFDKEFISPGHWDDTCDSVGGVVSREVGYAWQLQSHGHLNPDAISIHNHSDGTEEYYYECLKTCVAAGTGGGCDNTTLACAGGGSSFGSDEEKYMAIADAVATPSGFNPMCAMTRFVCAPKATSSYWQGTASLDRVQVIYPLDVTLIEIRGNEWYYNCERTGVGMGGTWTDCDPRYVFCAGQDGVYFGYGSHQMTQVATAVAAGGLHPLAPRGCDDNVYRAGMEMM